MSYTKGPWKQESAELSICRLIVSVEDVSCEKISTDALTIAYVPTDYERDTQMANARLIATAPELYEALKALCNYIDAEGPPAKEWQAISGWAEKGRAALAKAEGRDA